LRKVRDKPIPAVDDRFEKEMKKHTEALRASNVAFGTLKARQIDAAKLDTLLDQVLAVAGDVTRILLQPEGQAAQIRAVLEQLRDAEALLSTACGAVSATMIERGYAGTLSQLYAGALLDLARGLHPESTELRAQFEAGARFEARLTDSFPHRLLVHHVVYESKLAGGIVDALSSMREWLGKHLTQKQGGTHCMLSSTVAEVNLPAAGFAREPTAVLASSTVDAGDTLLPAVSAVMRSCICDALLPPCAPCEDSGVLLACLTVEDCKVIDICNLDRKFVLTAPNFRYWLPEICRLGQTLEQWCCPPCHGERDVRSDEEFARRSPQDSLYAAVGVAPAYTGLAGALLGADSSPRAAAGAARRSPLDFILPLVPGSRAAVDAEELERARAGSEAELRQQLDGALAEIKALRREHTQLRDKVAKIEGKKGAGAQT
jgi:hypothetical protein